VVGAAVIGARGVVIGTATYKGATKDAMQKAVRDALIGFMAATAGTSRSHEARSEGRKAIAE
jgi:hypothetical protein